MNILQNVKNIIMIRNIILLTNLENHVAICKLMASCKICKGNYDVQLLENHIPECKKNSFI
jgi:hypothetical protein